MSQVVLRAAGLSKQYRIGQRARYGRLTERLSGAFTAPLNRLRGKTPVGGTVWALKDVSFEAAQGDVLGIVGRNGAGKTTLLKILARITEPTEGFAELQGRVGSLLEVGTGFHPELTGRENVYLNGAMIGMRKREVDRKFDRIVDFAGVETFLDTPVKRFSSGMQLRLAFAVAAHLESNILVIDEVLAVGDLEFQQKCLGVMQESTSTGRTVLFVSHQMSHIRRFCSRAAWIEQGSIRMLGDTASVVTAYEQSAMTPSEDSTERSGLDGAKARFVSWRLTDETGDSPYVLNHTEKVRVQFDLDVRERVWGANHGIALLTSDGQLMWSNTIMGVDLEPGAYSIHYELPMLPLRPGTYRWLVSIFEAELIDKWDCVPSLVIATPPAAFGTDEWTGVLNVGCSVEIGERS